MKLKQKAAVLAAAAALLVAGSAEASIFIDSYSFSGLESGTFSLVHNTITNSYGLSAFDMTIGSAHYDLGNTGLADVGSKLVIGSTSEGVGAAAANTDSFWILFDPSSLPGKGFMNYSYVGYDTINSGYVNIGFAAAGVPEPATWAMLLLGVLGLGAAIRIARRKADAGLTAA